MNNHSVYKYLASNIKYYRTQQNITQEELSEKISKSVRYLSYLENGNANVTLNTIIDIAEIFDVEPYILIKNNKYQVSTKKVYKNK